MSDLHERVAKALGWSVKDARSMSMQALRELVRPVDPSLARELDYMIQSGAYIRGEPTRKPRPHHATVGTTAGTTKIWKRRDWRTPGATEPLKYDWERVKSDVSINNADAWLSIFRRDEPGIIFVASPTKPRAKRGPKIMTGPGMSHATRRAHATQAPGRPLVEEIRPGSRVTIVDRFGKQRTGRAVMRGPHGWLLNMGGRHGTPAIASADNIVAVKG